MAGGTSSGSESESVELARERTALAYERTLMAWIRTCGSMITSGFALYKLFYYMHAISPVGHRPSLLGARVFGLALIGIGVVMLVLIGVRHHRRRKARPSLYRQTQLTFVVGALLVTLGLVAFAVLIFRM